MKIQTVFSLAVYTVSSHLLEATPKAGEHAACSSAPSTGTCPIHHLGTALPTALERVRKKENN